MASNWNRYSTLPLVIGLASILLSPALRGADTLSTYLRLDDNVLRVTAEQPVRLSLTLPGGETWSQANVGHFQVRTYGKTESVPCHPDPDTGEVLYAFPSTGLALVILSVGPAATKGHPDSWQRTPYCTKLIVRVEDANGSMTPAPTPNPGITAKVGSKVEIRPLVNPTALSSAALAKGADFAVRVYYEGSAQARATVTARGPHGATQTATTDASGLAYFKIDGQGRWLLRYQKKVEPVTYTADLLFEVGRGP